MPGKKQLSKYRRVWEKHNGKIPKGYHIHHRDGDPSNNDISNLVCLSPSEHRLAHSPDRENKRKLEIETGFISITPESLRIWMINKRLRLEDVASGSRVSYWTVKRFIQKVSTPHLITVRALEAFVRSHDGDIASRESSGDSGVKE